MPDPQTASSPPSLDLNTVLKDQRFKNLPTPERHKFLMRNFPQYASLPPEEQHKFFVRNAMSHGEGGEEAVSEVGRQIKRVAGGMLGSLPLIPGVPGSSVSDVADMSRGKAPSSITNLPEIFKAPWRDIQGEAQPGRSVFEAPQGSDRFAYALDRIIGGDPDTAGRQLEQGNRGASDAALFTGPLITLGLAKLFGSLIPKSEPIAPTRRTVSSLQSMTGQKGITGTGPIDAASRTAAIQDLYRQALSEAGETDATLSKKLASGERAGTQSDIVGSIGRGNDLILRTVRDAVDIAQRPLDAVMDTYGKQPPAMLNLKIGRELRTQAIELGKVDERMGRALSALADKVESAKTFGELNDIKVHANKLVNDVYSAIPGKAIQASAETAYAYKLAADAIRSDMYPVLEQLSGSKVNLSAMGQREADAIAMRDAIHHTYYSQVAPQLASREASSFLGYVFGGEGPSHSLYSRHILARGAEKAHLIPGPGGQFNTKFRKATEVGEGSQPERVTVSPRQQKALPPPPGGGEPYKFTIPTGLPEEVTEGRSVTPAAKRMVPRSDEAVASHAGGEAQSPEEAARGEKFWRVKRNGTLSYNGTSPDANLEDGEALIAIKPDGSMRVQNHRTPYSDSEVLSRMGPRISAASRAGRNLSVPMPHSQPVEPASAGSRPNYARKWQYLTGSAEPTETASISGGGRMTTADPKIAQETLMRMEDHLRRQGNIMRPEIRSALERAVDDLREQLRVYNIHKGKVSPVDVGVSPYKRGSRPIAHRQAKSAAAAVGAAQTPRLNPPPRSDDEDERE